MIVAAQAPSTTKGIYCIGLEAFDSPPMTVALRRTLSTRRGFFAMQALKRNRFYGKWIFHTLVVSRPQWDARSCFRSFVFIFGWLRVAFQHPSPQVTSLVKASVEITHMVERTGKKWTWRCVAREGKKFRCRRCRSNFITRQPLHARSAGEMTGECVYSEKKGGRRGKKASLS